MSRICELFGWPRSFVTKVSHEELRAGLGGSPVQLFAQYQSM
jgi:hypothetical protein